MSRETDTLVHETKQTTAEKLDLKAMRHPGRSTPEPVAPVHNPGLGERIKRLFSNMTKALEGDHEFHNYLGG